MRTVLYTQDLLPITVLDVPRKWLDVLHDRGRIELAVMPQVKLCSDPDENIAMYDRIQTCSIWMERFVRGSHESLMLFTDDEEAALLLQSDFLPGQLRELRERQIEAYGRGVFDTLFRALGE